MEGGKKVSVSFFHRPDDHEFVEKMCLGASYSTSNKLLLIARHIMTTGLQKCLFKLAAPPSIVNKVRTGSKSSQGT